MRKLISLMLMLCLLGGSWAAALVDTIVTVDAGFAAFDMRKSMKMIDSVLEEDVFDAFFRANYSYDIISEFYYLDRIEMNVNLTRCESEEAALTHMEEALQLQLEQEPEGSAYVPVELEDGTILYVLSRPGEGFEKPYDCRGVKGNISYYVIVYLSDPAGEPEERSLLVTDFVAPIVLSLQATEADE